MFKAYLFVIFLLHVSLQLLAQLPASDHFVKTENNQSDTLIVKQLNQQCWLLRRTDQKAGIAIGKRSLQIAKDIRYREGEAQVLNYLGILYLRLDDSRTASAFFFKALALSDSLHLNIEKGYALNNIASSFSFERDYNQALSYVYQSLSIQTQNKDKMGIAYSWARMSDVYKNLQQYDSLLITATKANELMKELGMNQNSLIAIKNIGHGWEGKKQYAKALNCYMTVVNDTLISQETARDVYADLVRVYNLLKLPDQSILFGKKWLSFKKDNDIILKYIAEAYSLKGDWKEAFNFALMSMELRDSLSKDERFSQIKNLQVLYETGETKKENSNLKEEIDKKNLFMITFGITIILICLLVLLLLSKRNQQIRLNQILNQKNDEISIQRDHLNELNQTKDKLFSIIAHDLRGPIGNTSSFLEVLTENDGEFTKEQLLENLILLKDSSKATFKLLENLLTWARSQKGEIEFNPVPNDLFKVVQSNIDLFASNAENKKILILNNLDQYLIFDFDSDMINTVVRNLINNAIKYTREAGQITISAKKVDSKIEISVNDTGIGIDSETAKKLFTSDLKPNKKEGTIGEKGTGLGLILCKEFVLKHNGNIWAESELGRGSTFSFTLPYFC